MELSDRKLRRMVKNRARLKADRLESLRLLCVEEAAKTTRTVAPWVFMWLMIREVSGTLIELSEKFSGAAASFFILMVIYIGAILLKRGESHVARLHGELLRRFGKLYKWVPRRKDSVARTSMPDRETIGGE